MCQWNRDLISGHEELRVLNLEDTWKIAHDAGAKVLALSIPECAARVGGIVERRRQLNDLIANHEADRW